MPKKPGEKPENRDEPQPEVTDEMLDEVFQKETPHEKEKIEKNKPKKNLVKEKQWL
jgi:hypothetical protein